MITNVITPRPKNQTVNNKVRYPNRDREADVAAIILHIMAAFNKRYTASKDDSELMEGLIEGDQEYGYVTRRDGRSLTTLTDFSEFLLSCNREISTINSVVPCISDDTYTTDKKIYTLGTDPKLFLCYKVITTVNEFAKHLIEKKIELPTINQKWIVEPSLKGKGMVGYLRHSVKWPPVLTTVVTFVVDNTTGMLEDWHPYYWLDDYTTSEKGLLLNLEQ